MRSSNFMNYYDLCKIQRNSTINNAIHLVRTGWRSISCAWFEKIWSFHERVTERIWSRTILVQRKGHTNQRPLSFERRRNYCGRLLHRCNLFWRGQLKCCGDSGNAAMRFADQTEPAVCFRKEASGTWPHCHLQDPREVDCFRDTERLVELDMFTEVNLDINWKVTSYGGREKNEDLKSEK